MAGLTTRYGTPLAVILVALGLLFSNPAPGVARLSIGLLALSLAFNLALAKWVRTYLGDASGWIRFRLFLNIALNLAQVYLLSPVWPPIWLMLTLTPLATAIYEDRASTLASSCSISLLLLAINLMRGINSTMEWGMQLAYAAFIILMSLMVNVLSASSRVMSKPD